VTEIYLKFLNALNLVENFKTIRNYDYQDKLNSLLFEINQDIYLRKLYGD